jgi:uncharacterized phage protein (TIGR01671 family)
MREILFRGKTKDGRWIYGDLWHRPYGNNSAAIVSFTEDTGTTGGLEVIPETVGQYTGLKDKNGVEIYEGDILETWNKRYDGSPFSEKYENDLVVVKHNLYEGYLLHYILKFCGISNNVSRINEVSNYRVVGNIHENPELLEELNAK